MKMEKITDFEEKLSRKDFKEKFIDLFSISYCLNNCIIKDDVFVNNFDLTESLSPLGQARFQELKTSMENPSNGLISTILLKEFYHEDLYFDLDKLKTDFILKFFTEAIQNESIHFIWCYGKHLYDKYFEEFEEQSEDLSYEESVKLLNGTYQGVYQLSDLIFGPHGVIRGAEKRFIPPKLHLHLWHCPDPSCSTFHVSELNNDSNNQIIIGSNKLSEIQKDHEYQDVQKKYFDEIHNEKYYYDQFSLESLHELFGNCFGRQELSVLLEKLMHDKDFRLRLPNKFKKGNPTDHLNKAECLQLILIASDDLLLNQTEKLIAQKIIEIPKTEIRESHLTLNPGHFNTFLKCNQLGIRVVSDDGELSNLNLKKLLKDVHRDSPLREQLEWKLKSYTAQSTIDQKLDKYLFSEDPKKIVSETLLIGPTQLNKTFELLPGAFEMPIDQAQEKYIIDKILWKLGFDISLYPDQLSKLWKRLDSFKVKVQSTYDYNEDDKEQIRSFAVNLFVSLEEILEQSLSFLTWVLLSDHYIDTKFNYVFEEARDFMVSTLHGHEFTEGEKLILDRTGKNTLFPLLQGFNSLVENCEETIGSSGNYKRPVSEFPSFYSKDPIRVFPFEHKKFLLDMNPNDYENLKKSINQISKDFSSGDVLNVRNRLQHKRDSFPTNEEITNAINAIDRSISHLENFGIYPDVYLIYQKVKDKFNRTQVIMTNYKGKHLKVSPSPELGGTHLPSFNNSPLIIFENIKLGLTSQPIRFRFKEKSKYQTYWKNYPRKKK